MLEFAKVSNRTSTSTGNHHPSRQDRKNVTRTKPTVERKNQYGERKRLEDKHSICHCTSSGQRTENACFLCFLSSISAFSTFPFSPSTAVIERLYDSYSFSVIPAIGETVAGDRASYEYLVESIRKFPPQEVRHTTESSPKTARNFVCMCACLRMSAFPIALSPLSPKLDLAFSLPLPVLLAVSTNLHVFSSLL